MFYQINNKKRFAIGNQELKFEKINLFFYKNEDIKSFEIVRKKWMIEDGEDDFFKKNSFCRINNNFIKKKPNLKQLNFFFLKKLKKNYIKIFFQKINRFDENKQIDNFKIKKFEKINTININAQIGLSSNFLKKHVISQNINFFYIKKIHNREFFKQKVQLKNHTFLKSIVNVDIYTKKLKKIDYNFCINSYTLNTNINKIENVLSFLPQKCINSKYKYSFFKKTYQNKFVKKLTNNIFFYFPVDCFYNSTNKKIHIQINFKKFTNTFLQNLSNNKTILEKMYTNNLLKLIQYRNNYLTNEFDNFNFYSNYKNFSNEDALKTLNYLPKFNNQYVLNNFLPYYNFNVKKKFYNNVILRNILNPSFSLYYSYYLFNFLELFLKKKIWLKINTKSTGVLNNKANAFILDTFNQNKNDQFSVGRHFYLLEFLEILYISLFYRDLKFFSYWFKKTMEKLHLKKHRKLIKVVQNTLKNNLEFLSLLNVNGFTMDVRGKLGTTGNSKKKHYAFTVGSMSPTSKNHDMSLNQTTVRTSTGVLGVTITLSY